MTNDDYNDYKMLKNKIENKCKNNLWINKCIGKQINHYKNITLHLIIILIFTVYLNSSFIEFLNFSSSFFLYNRLLMPPWQK